MTNSRLRAAVVASSLRMKTFLFFVMDVIELITHTAWYGSGTEQIDVYRLVAIAVEKCPTDNSKR